METSPPKKLFFCDGISATCNQWFNLLPFAPNKGEAIIIECEGLNNEHVFKRGMMLAPLPVQNTYWVGSNYQWEFEDDQPSEKFYRQTTELLKHWLKLPFRVLFHKAAVRRPPLNEDLLLAFIPFIKILEYSMAWVRKEHP
jgi:hypothetical protein